MTCWASNCSYKFDYIFVVILTIWRLKISQYCGPCGWYSINFVVALSCPIGSLAVDSACVPCQDGTYHVPEAEQCTSCGPYTNTGGNSGRFSILDCRKYNTIMQSIPKSKNFNKAKKLELNDLTRKKNSSELNNFTPKGTSCTFLNLPFSYSLAAPFFLKHLGCAQGGV